MIYGGQRGQDTVSVEEEPFEAAFNLSYSTFALKEFFRTNTEGISFTYKG